jgi:hypothetical protein
MHDELKWHNNNRMYNELKYGKHLSYKEYV